VSTIVPAEIFRAGAGDGFTRHPANTAPYVNHPTEVTAKGLPRRVMYGRCSNFGSQIEDRFGIQKWSERRVLQGCTLLPDEIRKAIASLDLESLTDCQLADGWVVDAKAEAGAFIAAGRGTLIHLASTLDRNEADPLLTLALRGEDELGVPTAVTDAVLDSWAVLLERHGLHQLAIEQTVVDDHWRLAGTLDRVVQLTEELSFGAHVVPAGSVCVLDIKTGRLRIEQGHPLYWHAYSVQLASYAHSVPYHIDGLHEEREAWPWPISQRHALIAHLDINNALEEGVATARLFHVDLVEGLRAGNLARQARDWQASKALFVEQNVDPVATTVRDTAVPF
jgi:hypothetical protein